SKSGYTALIFATIKNDANSVKALLAAGADASQTLPDGARALTVAASYRATAAALALIAGGADPSAGDRTGNTPLHIASQGDLDLIKALRAKGANLNAPPADPGGARRGGGFFRPAGGQTPLFTAARAGQIEAMRLLLEAGADPKVKAPDGGSFLMAAVGSAN